MRVEVKKLSDTAQLPVRGSEQAAGYDLCADIVEQLEIAPGETAKVTTGLAFAIPEGYFGGIFATKRSLYEEGTAPGKLYRSC